MNDQTRPVSGYWNTNDIMKRFKISKMTIWRWMNREKNPLPKPRINQKGASSLWAIEDVVEWEESMSRAA
jgi:predicted DNA-binding transcriptional regulator AlpA